MNKICIACNKRPARIKFIKVVDGKWQDCMICQTCAMRFASQQGAGSILKLDHILKGLMEQGAAVDPQVPGKVPSSPGLAAVAPDLTCTGCGLSFLSYRNTLILGCSECYASFHDRLADDLRRFHGALRHVGRLPGLAAAPKAAPGALQVAHLISTEAAAAPDPAADPVGPPPDMASLKRQLHEAISREDFESAARIRDIIRKADTRSGNPGDRRANQ